MNIAKLTKLGRKALPLKTCGAVIVAAAYTGALAFGGKKLAARSARSAG